MVFSAFDKLISVYKNFNQKNIVNKDVRNDGWVSILTGQGVSDSRLESNKFIPEIYLSKYVLTELYKSDGISKRIVNMVVHDSLRNFIECDVDLMRELVRLNFKQHITDAGIWGRLYGGCAIVAFIDDGRDMDRPLNYKNIRKVVSLRTYDRYQISWLQEDICKDFYDVCYGEPEIYTIHPYDCEPFKVHKSRMYIMGGEKIPNLEKINNNYWDTSVLQDVFTSIRNYTISLNASAEIVQNYIQVVVGINDLELLLSAPNGEKLVRDRLRVHDTTTSNYKSVFIDSEKETYEKHNSSVAGLADLLDRFIEHICAVKGIPVTKFGRAPAGLNSTGVSDANNWDNVVEAYRTDQLAPCVDWFIKILESQTLWDKKPENYLWKFPSLKPIDELQLAQIRLLSAQTDAIYIDRGISCPFIFSKRYSDEFYNTDICIQPEDLKDLLSENALINPEDEQILKDVTEEINNKYKKTTNVDSINTDYEFVDKKVETDDQKDIVKQINLMLHKKIADKLNGRKL
jgi:phage-related protein (TIGR01555 family)